MDLQAVIFDYGEVLSGPPDPQAHRNLLAIAGVEEEAFEKAYWAHRLDYDADILNGQTYWQTVARDTGCPSRRSRSANCWNRTRSCG